MMTPNQTAQQLAAPPRRTAKLRTWLYQALVRLGPAALLGALILTAWQLYVTTSGVLPTVLPAPTRVAMALYTNAELLLQHALVTLAQTALGLAIAVVSALILALAIDSFALLRRALYPWLVAFRTVPIIVLAPLMLIWFGFGMLPKVLLVSFFCFFPIVVATADGLARSDPELLKLLRSMKGSRWQVLRLVRWPTALPSFFSGLRIAAAFSVAASVFAEYVGGYAGLGVLMLMATNARATPLVFAAVVITALASFTLFALVSVIERRAVPWQRP